MHEGREKRVNQYMNEQMSGMYLFRFSLHAFTFDFGHATIGLSLQAIVLLK